MAKKATGDGVYRVTGDHTYIAPGTYTLNIQVIRIANGQTASTSSTGQIGSPSPTFAFTGGLAAVPRNGPFISSGYATTNVFNYQTKDLTDMYASLSEQQRKAAVKPGTWKDEHGTIKPPRPGEPAPGLSIHDKTKDQRELVEKVMRDLVAPYRKEDGDEVMEIIKANGGLEKIGLMFYQEGKNTAAEPWTYWRLEGPGFVWSFRALPHIHTFVSVSSKLG